jgi:hypothetical protein
MDIKRIRREIRDLSNEEWVNIVKAFWKMKKIKTSIGKQLYGENYISYDDLVAKHMSATINKGGDLAHFSPIFPIFHRLI